MRSSHLFAHRGAAHTILAAELVCLIDCNPAIHLMHGSQKPHAGRMRLSAEEHMAHSVGSKTLTQVACARVPRSAWHIV